MWFSSASTLLASPSRLQVKRGVNKVVAEIVGWSLKHAARGVAPKKGFYREAFPPNTWRFGMAGKEMAGGARMLRFYSRIPFSMTYEYQQRANVWFHLEPHKSSKGHILLLEKRSQSQA